MNSEIRKLLESVRSGETSVDDAMLELKKAPFEDIGYAKVDLHRKVRQGAAEVIYGAGKTPEQIGGIIDAMRANGQNRVLITRMSPEAAAHVGSTRELDYHKDARVGIVGGLPQPDGIGKVVIATGGTSDIPVAEEAALTAQAGLARQVEKLEFTPGELTVAFAANQRDEVRDLHDVAGALSAQPGMKQQTFVAGFSAGAGASAGSIAYSEQIAPTLKGSASGNCMPSILCLNDQGGSIMDCSEDVSGTLRAQEHGHQPLVFDNHGQDTRFCGPVDCAQTISASFGEGGNNQPLVYENHGIDARYTGPHPVVPTLSARAGTGGNNLPLVEQAPAETFCITGNAIDRQPQNGGNGIGYQEDVSYTLTATDHHAVFSRQRADKFSPSDVASTESARQYKDATDLIHQAAGRGSPQLIRRLTPLECERLQGFPDGWTALPGASDSARYRALGNSVAIPCVEFIMRGVIIAAGYSA